MEAYQIYNKNQSNEWMGFVIADSESEAEIKVLEKHPHFSDSDMELVWYRNRGTWKSKSFGLEKCRESVDEVMKYSNVII